MAKDYTKYNVEGVGSNLSKASGSNFETEFFVSQQPIKTKQKQSMLRVFINHNFYPKNKL